MKTVQELIDMLQGIEDKSRKVMLYSRLEEGGSLLQKSITEYDGEENRVYWAGCTPDEVYPNEYKSFVYLIGG